MSLNGHESNTVYDAINVLDFFSSNAVFNKSGKESFENIGKGRTILEPTYPCFPVALSNNNNNNKNNFSKPLAAFPHNHCRNNGHR